MVALWQRVCGVRTVSCHWSSPAMATCSNRRAASRRSDRAATTPCRRRARWSITKGTPRCWRKRRCRSPPTSASIPTTRPPSKSSISRLEPMNKDLTPKAIVAALDTHIIGQDAAKRAVAVALRNRWRRQQLAPELRDEVSPKNILMIGPTGCGKTEISRRLAKLADAPFIKVEATKFTEVGYVGRDVEQIARDLVEEAVRLEKDRRREAVRAAAEEAAMERLLDALTGKGASEATRQSFRQRIREGHLDDSEVEIEVSEAPSMNFELPGQPGQMSMINLSDMLGKAMGGLPKKRRKLTVLEAATRLIEEEQDKRLDQDDVARVALADAEANGIVFLAEIDKIGKASRRERVCQYG